jgi:hypothetical protein
VCLISDESSVILAELFLWFFSVLPGSAFVFIFYTRVLHWTLPVTESPFTVQDVASGSPYSRNWWLSTDL